MGHKSAMLRKARPSAGLFFALPGCLGDLVELSGITPLILLLPITSCAASSKVRAGGLEIPCPGRFDGGLAADGHPKLEVLGSVNFED
jgi:hypothetical protein